jgi:hypothetical protein
MDTVWVCKEVEVFAVTHVGKMRVEAIEDVERVESLFIVNGSAVSNRRRKMPLHLVSAKVEAFFQSSCTYTFINVGNIYSIISKE